MDNSEARKRVRDNLPLLVEKLNAALRGDVLDDIVPILKRIDNSRDMPRWFDLLCNEKRLANKDGKTAGSIIEKLFVCVIEHTLFKNEGIALSINPAKGIDIPELKLGVKSPSTNYCTSEPFFSAYDRVLGNECDVIVLLTDYQESKKREQYILQIINHKYLRGSEIADKNLCAACRELRSRYGDSPEMKRILKFVAYINQSDWEAKTLLKLLTEIDIEDGESFGRLLIQTEQELMKKNKKRTREGKEPIWEDALDSIKIIAGKSPHDYAIVGAMDNWLADRKSIILPPSDSEWIKFLRSPLDGKIGMSFALQWRYNFGMLFRVQDDDESD